MGNCSRRQPRQSEHGPEAAPTVDDDDVDDDAETLHLDLPEPASSLWWWEREGEEEQPTLRAAATNPQEQEASADERGEDSPKGFSPCTVRARSLESLQSPVPAWGRSVQRGRELGSTQSVADGSAVGSEKQECDG